MLRREGQGFASRLWRLLRWPLLLLLVAALAVRLLLTIYAAEIFLAALDRVAKPAGLVVVFDEAPSVSLEGFEAGAVTLRDAQGRELLRAAQAKGKARLFFGEPWLTTELELSEASLSWPGASGDKREDFSGLPPQIAALRFDRSRVDLGEGRTLELDGSFRRESARELSADIARLEYREPSGERAAEKGRGRAKLLLAEDGALHFDASVDAGALLVDAVLLDFSAQPLSMRGKALARPAGGVDFSSLEAKLGTLLTLSGSASVDAAVALRAGDLHFASDDLGPAFQLLLRDPFGGVLPAIAEAEVEGRGSLDWRFVAPSRHASELTLKLSLSRLKTRSAEAERLELELPWIGDSSGVKESRPGRLRARSLSLLSIPWKDIDITFSSSRGRLRALAPEEWPTFGGRLELRTLEYEDDAARGPRLSSFMKVHDLALRDLAAAAGFEGLEGRLHGDLGRVSIDADAVRIPGSLSLEAYDGRVLFENLSVGHPFSRVPAYRLDAKLEELNLGDLSAALGLGRINGVLEGWVRDLEVADGQAQSFEADLHTVEKRGVPQNIDVRAIVQLGVIGGGDSGSLTGALLKVIDRYRYSAIGLRGRLHNDVFEIRGVESREGRDYIVKGSLLPPTVSVVSHSQVVSFSEMLRRVRTIRSNDGGASDASP